MELDEAGAVILIVWALVGGIFTAAIWNNKGGEPAGAFILGLFFGILAIIYAAAATPKPRGHLATRECPHCREQIRRVASICPHCRKESPAWEFHEGYWWAKDGAGDWFWLSEKTGEWHRKGAQVD